MKRPADSGSTLQSNHKLTNAKYNYFNKLKARRRLTSSPKWRYCIWCYALQGNGSVGKWLVYLTAQHMVSQLQALAHGSVFSTITRQTFDAISLSVPSAKINEAFDMAVAHLQKLNGSESVDLSAIRSLLVPKLMSREITVRDAEQKMGEII
jgi:hypothetical protein